MVATATSFVYPTLSRAGAFHLRTASEHFHTHTGSSHGSTGRARNFAIIPSISSFEAIHSVDIDCSRWFSLSRPSRIAAVLDGRGNSSRQQSWTANTHCHYSSCGLEAQSCREVCIHKSIPGRSDAVGHFLWNRGGVAGRRRFGRRWKRWKRWLAGDPWSHWFGKGSFSLSLFFHLAPWV